jgi:hypothetical protein
MAHDKHHIAIACGSTTARKFGFALTQVFVLMFHDTS